MLLKCLLVLIAFGLMPVVDCYNYCHGRNATTLCKKGKKHFMCDLNSVPILDDLLAYVPLTNKVRNLILDVHNKKRALIANGEEVNKGGVAFPKATRLREFVWNQELAGISKVHAGRCNMKHDPCRNTYVFKYSGQNLAFRSDGDTLPSIEKMMNAWYDEKNKVAKPGEFADLFSDSKGTGHFSVMVNDRNAHLGCSVALCERHSKKGQNMFYITCNYGYTNMQGAIVYKKGDDAATDCNDWGTGKSSKYPGLCENSGQVFQ